MALPLRGANCRQGPYRRGMTQTAELFPVAMPTDLVRILVHSSCFIHVVRRQCGKASVLDWATHSEMVEALPIARRDAEHFVNRIIEVAADPGGSDARLFRLEVQHPAHRGQVRSNRSVKVRSKLQTVHLRCIVVNAGTVVDRVQRRQEQVSLRRVWVPARWIGTQRPCGSLELFPGC